MATVLWAYADKNEELNTSMYRVAFPSRVLAEQCGHECHITYILNLLQQPIAPKLQEVIDSSSVIVLERLLIRELQPLIENWRKQGKFVAASFDDAYHLLPPSGLSPFLAWRGGKQHKFGTLSDGSDKVGAILNEFRQTLRMVDTALVPSKVLADDYRPYCPTIQFVPNFVWIPDYDACPKRPIDYNFLIGWGGSSSHVDSFNSSGLPAALGSLCRKYPRLQFHINPGDPKFLFALDRFGVKYTAGAWIPFNAWAGVVKTFDLYVAPIGTEYDRRKSALKPTEAGAAGIPWVASDLDPYKEALGGIRCANKPSAWVDAISSLIDDRELYDRLAQEGRQWAVGLFDNAGAMYEDALGLKGQ